MPQSTLFNWMEQVWNTEVSSIVMQFFKKMSLDDLLWNKILRGWFNCLLHLKFIYSKKAKKICKIFTLLLSYVVPVKSKVKISRNFVAFSEYMNFKFQICIDCIFWEPDLFFHYWALLLYENIFAHLWAYQVMPPLTYLTRRRLAQAICNTLLRSVRSPLTLRRAFARWR